MTPQPERSSTPDRDDGTRVQSEPPATMEFSNDSTNPTFSSQTMGGVPGYPFLSPPLAADEIGRLGEYRILKKLGEGGMGFVFRGEDPGLKRFIALKVMRPEVAAKPQAAERFLREGRAAAGLKSDHIITIYRVGEANGVPFLAMEFLEGLPLDEWIKAQKKPVQLPQALRVVRDTLRGLATAHDKGLIHRDIKPANLWLEKGTSRIKLLDFGLTRGNDADMQITQEGAVVGTPAYMAPEQASGKPVDPRADLFSVGVVFYTLLAGKNPFARGSLMETLGAIGFESQPPIVSVRPDVPKEYSDFLDRLLAKIPDGRPAHAKAALQELAAIEKKLTDSSKTAPTALGVPLVAVPVPADAAPQVWGELEEGPTEPMVRLPKSDAAGPKAPSNKKLLLGGGLFAFLAVLGGIIIIITNKDGTKTKIEVPDDGTKVEVQKGGKTVASVGGKKEPPKTATMDADRKAAEFVLANGGFVTIGEREFRSGAPADLPAEPFKCLAINLAQATREINDAEADMLFKLDALQWLHLNYPLSDQNLARLVKLPASQSLVTWENNGAAVTDAGLKHFRAFRGLKRLVLYDVRASGAGLKDWAGWELEQLNIRTVTGFTDDNLMFLKDLPKLDNISLQGDSVTDVGVRRLAEVSTLRDVNLYSTKVSDAGIAALEKLPNINYLRVQFSGESTLTRECLKTIGRMKTLGCVVLDAPIGDADVKPLLALDGLGEVHLTVRNAEFTDAGLMNLAGIKLLHSLQVERSRITPDGVRKFRTARPEVKIGGELLAKADPDRAAAEWAIARKGSVKIGVTHYTDAAKLPPGPFKVAAINSGQHPFVTDRDVDRLRDLTDLVSVSYWGPITDQGLKALAELPTAGQFTELMLGVCDVTDAGLTVVTRFPKVTYFSFSGTKLTGAALRTLAAQPQLEAVTFWSGTPVTDADLEPLVTVPRLWKVDVAGTALTDTGLKKLLPIKALRSLKLFNGVGNITPAGAKAFQATRPDVKFDGDLLALVDPDRAAAEWVVSIGGWVCVNGEKAEIRAAADLPKGTFTLTAVDLYQLKSVTDTDLAQFKVCKSLLYLNLRGCTQVTNGGLANFQECKALTTLALSRVNMTDDGLEHFKHCDLTLLDLYATPVTDRCVPVVAAYKNLTILGFGSTKITDAGLVHLKGLKKLRHLNLQEEWAITDAGIAYLKELPTLTSLSLHRVPVTDTSLKHVRELRELSTLILNGTKVTEKGVAELHKSLPGCWVEHPGGVIEPLPDRKAAEWVLTAGGKVWVNGGGPDHTAATGLPKTPIRLSHVNLDGIKTVKDADLAILRGLRHLVYFGVSGSPGVTDAAMDFLHDSHGLDRVNVQGTQVTAAGVAEFRKKRPDVKLTSDFADPDRTAAEYVLSRRSGAVRTTAAPDRLIEQIKDLPAGPFELTEIIWKETGTTDADLDAFRDLRSLGVVDIRLGSVTDAGVEKLGGFPFAPKLGGLFLRSTGLTDKAFRTMVKFPAMTHLAIGGTDGITGSGIPHLAGTGIDYLMFDGCGKLADAEMVHLDKVPKLGSLAFHLCPITDAALKPIAKLKGLTSLRVAKCNYVTDAGIQQLEGLESLEWIDLSTSSLTPAVLRSVAKLKSLKAVVGFPAEPGFAKLSDADLKPLADAPSLEQLDVTLAAATDAGLETLARIKTLKELNLKGSKVTAAGVTKFKAALPACKVSSDFDTVADPDRAAAEALKPHCMSLGLKMPSGERRYLKKAEPLPDGRFELAEAYFSGQLSTLPPGFEADVLLPRLAPLRSFEVLRDPGGIHLKLTDKELKTLADAPVGASLVTLSLPIRLTPESLVQFRRLPNLREFVVDLRGSDEASILKLNEFPKVWTIGIDHFDPQTQATEKVRDMVRKLSNAHFMISETKSMTKPLAEAIGANRSFKTLYFWNTPVADDLLPVLFAGGKIASSTFAFTGLTDAGMKQIGRVSTLEILALVGVKGVTDVGLGELKGLKALRQIEIVGTKVTAEGVKKLKAALPECQVTGDFDAAVPVVDADRAAAEKLLPTFDLEILPAGTMETVKLKAGSPVPAGAFAVVGVRCWAAEALPKSFADDVLFPAIAPLTRLVLLEDSGSKLDMGKADPAKWAGIAAKDTLQNFELAVPLSDGWIDVFRQFPKLGAVHVHEARKVPAATLKRLSELKALDSLRIGAVAGSDRWDAITALPLKKLGVSVAPNMDAAACARIAAMPALDTVPFYDIAFTAEMLAALAPAPKLRSLTFTKCKLPATGYEHLARMPNLGALNIKGNEFGDAQLAQFGEAKTVQFLSVKDTAVTEAGVKALAAKRPNLTIEWKGGRYRDGR